MGVVTTMAIFIAAFATTHLTIAGPPIRGLIVDRIGSVRYAVIVSLLAWAGLGLVFWYYSAHRAEGPPGLELGDAMWLRGIAMTAMVTGVVLMVAIVAPSGYLDSAAVVFGRVSRAPKGLERITRHPFFVGLALFGLGHVLLASRMIGVVMFGGLALTAIAGARLQDRKLLAERKEPHAEYLRVTSIVPFWAIVRRRQSLELRELPWLFFGLGLGVAWGTHAMHNVGFEHGWLVVFAVSVVVPLWFAVASAGRHHRGRSQGPKASPHRR